MIHFIFSKFHVHFAGFTHSCCDALALVVFPGLTFFSENKQALLAMEGGIL
jgi:hypothetical protein